MVFGLWPGDQTGLCPIAHPRRSQGGKTTLCSQWVMLIMLFDSSWVIHHEFIPMGWEWVGHSIYKSWSTCDAQSEGNAPGFGPDISGIFNMMVHPCTKLIPSSDTCPTTTPACCPTPDNPLTSTWLIFVFLTVSWNIWGPEILRCQWTDPSHWHCHLPHSTCRLCSCHGSSCHMLEGLHKFSGPLFWVAHANWLMFDHRQNWIWWPDEYPQTISCPSNTPTFGWSQNYKGCFAMDCSLTLVRYGI